MFNRKDIVMRYNLFDEMSLGEKVWTLIQSLILVSFGILCLMVLRLIWPDYYQMTQGKQSKEYYEYYEDRYDMLESAAINAVNSKSEMSSWPISDDILFSYEVIDGKRMVTFSLDDMEDYTVEYQLDEKMKVLSKNSHRLEWDEFLKQAKSELNSLLGITVLLLMMMCACFGYCIYLYIELFCYFIKTMKE